MDKPNRIERLKDALHATDYKAIKHSEGWLTDEQYSECKAERQALRDEINRIEAMSEADYLSEFGKEGDDAEP